MENRTVLFFFIAFSFIFNDWTKELIPFGGIYLDFFRVIFLPLLFISIFFSLIVKPSFDVFSKRIFLLIFTLSIFYFFSALLSKDVVYSLKRWAFFTSNLMVVLICYVIYSTYYKGSVEIVGRTLSSAFKVVIIFSVVISSVQVLVPELAYRPEVRTLLGLSFQRVNSFFWDPNFYSCFLATATAYIFIFEKKDRGRLRISTYFIMFLSFLFMFLTGSRGGFLALIIANFFIYMLNFCKGKHGRLLIFFYIFIFPSLILMFSYFDFATNIDLITQKDDESLSALSRLLTWYSGINLWSDSPFFGIGPGNYVTYEKGAVLYGYVDSWRANQIDALAAHSNLLEILVESGIFSCLAYMFIFYKLISLYEYTTPTALACITAITVFYTCTLFLSYFTPWIFMVVAVLIYSNTYGRGSR